MPVSEHLLSSTAEPLYIYYSKPFMNPHARALQRLERVDAIGPAVSSVDRRRLHVVTLEEQLVDQCGSGCTARHLLCYVMLCYVMVCKYLA
jgi:hypothetical protein